MQSTAAASWRALGQPLRLERAPRGFDAAWAWTVGQIPRWTPRKARLWARSGRVAALQSKYETLSETALTEALVTISAVFRRGRANAHEGDAALALVAESASRVMGLRSHREQLMGAITLLDGCIAEMATGEGKTLTAALAAILAAWRGHGVHVVTVNDYLAGRDAKWMESLYQRCGVRVGVVSQDSTVTERREAYAADITYCTSKEAAADFLRDRLRLGASGAGKALAHGLLASIAGSGSEGGDTQSLTVQRGLACAIVDEADSVLIDEAVTPLIISGSTPDADARGAYEQAAHLAQQLESGKDYALDLARREVKLSRMGRERSLAMTEHFAGPVIGARRREELVSQALSARELYHRGKQYVVQDGKVVIVDEFTGRLMPDRTWRHGIHQAIEAKEGLAPREAQDTLARISFQRFFRLYARLGGMTGTAREAAGELWRTYRLRVVSVPTHKQVARRVAPDRVCATHLEKIREVARVVKAAGELGQPVLIGTRSVEASEQVSAALHDAGISHSVINAERHEQEAEIVGRAGEIGAVTVATNMAGRGTDIRLTEGVVTLGGLKVIATERHESGRVDRQLFGRAGRQGDPGEAQAIVSLEDELLLRFSPTMCAIARRARSPWLGRVAIVLAQRRATALAVRMRAGVLRSDDWLDDSLGFAGRPLS